MRSWRGQTALFATLISVALFVVYVSNGDFLSLNDTFVASLTVDSLIEDGDFLFSEEDVPAMIKWTFSGPAGAEPVRVFRFDEKMRALRASGELAAVHDGAVLGDPIVATKHPGYYASVFCPGASLVAFPFLATVRAVTGRLVDHPREMWVGSKIVASLCVAASAGFLFAAARAFLPARGALIVSLVYGLATCVWSVSSQALWQHGPNELFLAWSVFHLTRPRLSLAHAAMLGATLGLATLCRPTSALVVVAVAAWLTLRDRRSLIAYLVAGLPFALFLAGYNYSLFGSPFAFGQSLLGQLAMAKTGQSSVWRSSPWEGLAGVLVSPSRGLFVYSPVLLFSLWGAVRAWRDDKFSSLRPLTTAVLAIVGTESFHFDWWGGWSFGYRHLVDLSPLLAIFLCPIAGRLFEPGWPRRVFASATAWSVAVQFLGAWAYDQTGWNNRVAYRVTTPRGTSQICWPDSMELALLSLEPDARIEKVELTVDLPANHARLWSISDSPLVYYATRFRESRANRLAMAVAAGSAPPHDLALTYCGLGAVLDRQGRQAAALAWYDAALALDPDGVWAHFLRGEALWRLGKKREAAEEFERVVALEPGSGAGWLALGRHSLEQGRDDEAAARLTEALRRQPDLRDAARLLDEAQTRRRAAALKSRR